MFDLPILSSSESNNSSTVVIAGGGTGGHVFPGIALADSLERLYPSIRVVFVGTEDGLEAEVVPTYGYELRTMHVPTLKGSQFWDRLASLSQLPFTGLKSLQLLRSMNPGVVISAGGYAAGPITAVAGMSGIPAVLLEQNSVPGMTTRLLDRFVSDAFLNFDESTKYFKHATCHVLGNPIRREIRQLSENFEYDVSDSRSFHILVLGGSGGAGTMNAELPDTLERLELGEQRLRVTHQSGKGRRKEVEDAYHSFEGDVEIKEFIENMPRAYRSADLVICRAGATTISEILAVGVPALFVPFAGAADDHQTKNARVISEAGAGIELSDSDIGTESAVRLIRGLINNPVSLKNIAERAKQIGKPYAADTIAETIGERILKPRIAV